MSQLTDCRYGSKVLAYQSSRHDGIVAGQVYTVFNPPRNGMIAVGYIRDPRDNDFGGVCEVPVTLFERGA